MHVHVFNHKARQPAKLHCAFAQMQVHIRCFPTTDASYCHSPKLCSAKYVVARSQAAIVVLHFERCRVLTHPGYDVTFLSSMLHVRFERFTIFQIEELSFVVEVRHAVVVETVLLRDLGWLHPPEHRLHLCVSIKDLTTVGGHYRAVKCCW